MKKVMIMLAVVAMTAVTQAANVSWKLSTGSTYAGMNVYGITGMSAAEIVQAFGAQDDSSKWTAVVKGFSSTTASGGGRGAAAGESAGAADGGNIVFAIIDGDVAEGSKWYVTSEFKVSEGATFTPPATGIQQTYSIGSVSSGTFTLKSGPVDPSDVPEPTSGLLLVLGGAALALRRKQK